MFGVFSGEEGAVGALITLPLMRNTMLGVEALEVIVMVLLIEPGRPLVL